MPFILYTPVSRLSLALLQRFSIAVAAALLLMLSVPAPAEDLPLPADIPTFADGRAPIVDLYHQYLQLKEVGWILDIVSQSQPAGRDYALPVIALRTPHDGEAVWILSGVHGEETAGPNAIAESIDVLRELGEHQAVVLLPQNNPHGYVNNWRYLNVASYNVAIDGQSVGDSSHLLIDPENPGAARAAAASSPEADAITAYILAMSKRYPPIVSLDLHEDNLIDEGYVYSQGKLGADDPLAMLAVQVLNDNGIPLKMSGTTRFDEPISQGIIGPVIDSSVDELISASSVIVDGVIRPGPDAHTVLVFETPAAAMPLPQRVNTHSALLRQLATEISKSSTTHCSKENEKENVKCPNASQSVEPIEMRTVAIVTFPVSQVPDTASIRQLLEKTGPNYTNIPGLLRKYFLFRQGVGGGVYEWASRSQAEAFYNTEWYERMRQQAGVEPEVQLFDAPAIADGIQHTLDIFLPENQGSSN